MSDGYESPSFSDKLGGILRNVFDLNENSYIALVDDSEDDFPPKINIESPRFTAP